MTSDTDPLLPIESESSLDLAIAEINRLIELHPADLTEEQDSRLDALGAAVEAYEFARLAKPAPETPAADMPCFAEGCEIESTHSRSAWRSPGHMTVEYFCQNHAPADATSFEEDDRIEAELDRAENGGKTP